ncbi:MAG: hypothetical protein R3E58_13100 [Phycisphaerae bacterium]
MSKSFASCPHVVTTVVIANLFAVSLQANAGQGLYHPAPQLDSVDVERREEPDDPYERNRLERDGRSTGARQSYSRGPFVSIQVNVDSFGNNIVGDAANETSIAVNPTNPNQIVIGWRQFDSVASNFRQAGWGYSHDHGASWTFPGSIESGLFRSDPVLNVSPEGLFYYYSLRTDTGFVCDMFRSSNGGVTWGPRIPAFGGDKAWFTVDHSNSPGRGNIYASWSSAAACCGNNIFTRSVDGGLTYMNPVPVIQNPRFGQVATGPDGAVYIVDQAFGNVAILKSSDALDPPMPPTFQSNIAYIGGNTAFGGVNPAGLLGQMNIAVDHSNGPTHGNVYILGSVDPPGPDPLDVMFARSTDGGVNWDPPVRVNDDPLSSNSFQWFGTMSVAPNGRIDVIFNDTRASGNNSLSELYYTSSFDGGDTWTPNIPVSPQFNHSLGYPNQSKLGDYYDMVSDEDGADVAYAATFNLEEDVYYLRIGSIDCNNNGAEDQDDISLGTSLDCNSNSIPDECEGDCNGTGIPDDCDITNLTSEDCNANNRPDECELLDNDCNADQVPDDCQVAELEASLTSPSNQTVCPGSDAAFSVDSTLSGLSYQWLRSGIPLVEGVDATGTDSADLTVIAAEASDIGFYSCIVSDGCISTESDSAYLSLFAPVAITQQPTPLSQTCTGNTLALAVATVGDNVSYQWRRDGTPLSEQPGAFENVHTAQLHIKDIRAADMGEYDCVVSDECGGLEVSDSATFAIGDVEFTLQPIATCASAGETIELTSTPDAGGFSIFRQWHKDGSPLVNGGNISGAFTDTLVINDVTVADEGAYALRAISLGPNCVEFSDPVTLLLDTCTCETPGDMDMDGDLDLADLQQFTECFGKNVALANECACANIEFMDDIVNLNDWTLYAPILTGP